MRSCHQQIAEVAHRVGLDVVHVAQATKRRLVERVRSGSRRSRCRRRSRRPVRRSNAARSNGRRSSFASVAVLMPMFGADARRMTSSGIGPTGSCAHGIGDPSHSTSKNWAATRSVCLCAVGVLVMPKRVHVRVREHLVEERLQIVLAVIDVGRLEQLAQVLREVRRLTEHVSQHRELDLALAARRVPRLISGDRVAVARPRTRRRAMSVTPSVGRGLHSTMLIDPSSCTSQSNETWPV